MRTSLNETRDIDIYLTNQMDTPDRLLFDSRLLIDDSLGEKLTFQQKANELIAEHGRELLRKEIASIEEKLFRQSKFKSFQRNIYSIFKLSK